MKLALPVCLILLGLAFLAMKEFQAGEAHATSKRPHVLTITYTYTEEAAPDLDNCQTRASFWIHILSAPPDGWVRNIGCLPWGK